ncbi:hypothetical protein AB9E05_34685, partial [Rhizobium leguminosarum]
AKRHQQVCRLAGLERAAEEITEIDNLYWLESVSPEGVVFLKPIEEIAALAEGIDLPLILCGHSHIPRAVRLSDGRLIVNPGSV